MARSSKKQLVYEIAVRDKQATASLRRLSARFERLARPLDRINRKLRANQRALHRLTSRLNGFSKGLKRFGERASLAFTLPLAGVGAYTVKAAASFEAGMLRVQALTRATTAEFAALRAQAVRLGADTQFSARDAAQAMSYLAVAGFKTGEILKAVPATLELAGAGQLELAEAANLASNILRSYRKEASDLTQVSDKLTYAFSNSNTDIRQLESALVKVGGIASSAGVSFDEMTASVMALADVGHKAETAGVALAGGISRLLKPPHEAALALAKLGIQMDEILYRSGPKRGELKDFLGLIARLDVKGAVTADYMTIFGQEAGRYLVGLQHQQKKLAGYMDGLAHKSQGLSKSFSEQSMKGAEGAMKLFSSAFESLLLALGDTGLLKGFEVLTRALADIIQRLSNLDPALMRVLVIFGGLAAVVGPLALALGGFVTVLTTLLPLLGGPALLASLATATALGGAILLAIAGATAFGFLAAGVYRNWALILGKLEEAWEELAFKLKSLFWQMSSYVVDAINRVLRVVDELTQNEFAKLIAAKLGFNLDLVPRISLAKASPPVKPLATAKPLVTTNLFEGLREVPFYAQSRVWKPLAGIAADKEWQWLPDSLAKALKATEPLEDKGYRPLRRMDDDDGDPFDFRKLKESFEKKEESRPTREQPTEVRITFDNLPGGTRVRTLRNDRARVQINTGYAMSGAN